MKNRLSFLRPPKNRLKTTSNSTEKKGPKSFIGMLAIVVGALGGFTAMFIGFGYITIASCLSSLKIYGLVEFPVQFYREAPISFIRSILEVYSENFFFSNSYSWILLIIAIGILIFLLIPDIRLKWLNELVSWIYLAGVFTVIVLTLLLERLKKYIDLNAEKDEMIFYFIILPVLASLFFYLSRNFQKFGYPKPFFGKYGVFLIFFIILFISIPIIYGSYFFDLDLYQVTHIECSETPKELEQDEFELFYIMGHTADREIFAKIKTEPPYLVIVEKELLSSISVRYEAPPTMSLRKLFGRTKVPDLDMMIREAKGTKEELSEEEKKRWK